MNDKLTPPRCDYSTLLQSTRSPSNRSHKRPPTIKLTSKAHYCTMRRLRASQEGNKLFYRDPSACLNSIQFLSSLLLISPRSRLLRRWLPYVYWVRWRWRRWWMARERDKESLNCDRIALRRRRKSISIWLSASKWQIPPLPNQPQSCGFWNRAYLRQFNGIVGIIKPGLLHVSTPLACQYYYYFVFIATRRGPIKSECL